MAEAPHQTAPSDSYLALVRAFPLRAIRTEAGAVAAGDVLSKLLLSKPAEKMDAGERDYVEALAALIQQYQDHEMGRTPPKASGVQLLKHLMEERGMTASDLGRVIGHQPTASQILRGERELSKAHIRALSDHFKMSPAAFFD